MSATCQRMVWADSWGGRTCGKPVKRNGLCGLHASADERANKSAESRRLRRERGEAAARVLTDLLGLPVHYSLDGVRDEWRINAAQVNQWWDAVGSEQP